MPNAKQIVDRFHILKNLTDDLCNYLKRTVSDRIKLYKQDDFNTKEVLTKRQQDKIDTANRKWELIKEAKQLYQNKHTKTFIAKKLGITRVTLNIYLSLEEPPVKDSNCILDNYLPLIKQCIIDGKKTKEIFEKIKASGYKGKMTVLNMHLKSIRNEVKNNISYLKRSKIKKLFFYNLEDIKNENLKQDLIFYLNQNEELKKIIDLEKEFKNILFSKKSDKLELWLEKAKQLDVIELNSFINRHLAKLN